MCAERGIEEVCGIEEGTIFFFLFLLQNLKKIFTTSLMELFSVFFIKHLSTSDNYGGKIIMHANIMHAKIMNAKRDNQYLAYLFRMTIIKIITIFKTRRPIAPIIIYKWIWFSLFSIKKILTNEKEISKFFNKT